MATDRNRPDWSRPRVHPGPYVRFLSLGSWIFPSFPAALASPAVMRDPVAQTGRNQMPFGQIARGVPEPSE
jgi:hypothetical protein